MSQIAKNDNSQQKTTRIKLHLAILSPSKRASVASLPIEGRTLYEIYRQLSPSRVGVYRRKMIIIQFHI